MVFRVDTRSWGDHRTLYLSSAPAVYKTWRQRALDYLSRDRDGFIRSDVRRLLLWAEKQLDEIGQVAAQVGAFGVGLLEPAAQVSDALYPAIRGIVANAVMQRSERCQGDSGIELWRRLYMEWRGGGGPRRRSPWSRLSGFSRHRGLRAWQPCGTTWSGG